MLDSAEARGDMASEVMGRTVQSDTSCLGLSLQYLLMVVSLSAQSVEKQNQINQTQSETGCVTLYLAVWKFMYG